jgi:chorismate lyase / 3-hydroxybenzoate synthase
MQVGFSFRPSGSATREPSTNAEVFEFPVPCSPLFCQGNAILGSCNSELFSNGRFRYLESNGIRFGYGTVEILDGSIEANVQAFYDELWTMLGEFYAYRIWHFIENINDESDDLEVYRRFCTGRANSYRNRYGIKDEKAMCAASAVGVANGGLTLFFIAGMVKPQYFENPLQTPAYHYPIRFGPNSPSFCRATRVQMQDLEAIFISGTASIRGCNNVAVGNLDKQVSTTMENLSALSAELDMPRTFDVAEKYHRLVFVYIRHPEDWERVHQMLYCKLYDKDDSVVIVQSDICRAELDIEIELTLIEYSVLA